MFVLLMGSVFGYEKERLTVHLWAASEGVTLKKRGGIRGGNGWWRGSSALQTTSALT